MRDLIFLLIVVVFFIVASLFVRACGLISNGNGPHEDSEKS